jgi:iron complex outermembrane receptor protein
VTKFNYSNALNNFQYYNDQTRAKEKLTNAVYVLGGITQEAFFRLSKKDILSARIWYCDNSHQIPPITTNTSNVHIENQKDQSIRSLVEWRRSDETYFLNIRSSLVDQFMQYTLYDKSWNHHSYSWANRARLVYSGIEKFTIRPGIEFNSDWVISDSYNGEKTRNTLGIFSEFNYSVLKSLQLSLVLRQDMIDGKFLPFIPALAIEYKPFKNINLAFSSNFCRNYRFPTLNDLYFEPYGNAQLKPETDYSVEGSMVYNFGKKDVGFFLESTITGYYSKIINQILWLPDTTANYKPINISEVHARGMEAGLNLAWSNHRFRISSANTWNYCRSTNEKSRFPGDNSVGKQLIYTPVNTFNTTLTIRWFGFYISDVFSYIGERFTSTDNSSFMPGYYLSNIILGKDFHLNKIILSLQLHLNNLFDLDYQSIANRPMPGRNYALTLKFNFRK